jgi:hypothetical protein
MFCLMPDSISAVCSSNPRIKRYIDLVVTTHRYDFLAKKEKKKKIASANANAGKDDINGSQFRLIFFLKSLSTFCVNYWPTDLVVYSTQSSN